MWRLWLLCWSLWLWAAPALSWERLAGRVTGVTDGDTLTVLTSDGVLRRIRLAGIDAPEKSQDYGDRAKRVLSQLAYGQPVEVWLQGSRSYDRWIGKVLVNGRDVGLEMLKAGMAWHYSRYAHQQPPEDREAYRQAEAAARASAKGLWSMSNPVPPWEYRRRR